MQSVLPVAQTKVVPTLLTVRVQSVFQQTLVSRDTREVYFSRGRQQFLVDQGYAFQASRLSPARQCLRHHPSLNPNLCLDSPCASSLTIGVDDPTLPAPRLQVIQSGLLLGNNDPANPLAYSERSEQLELLAEVLAVNADAIRDELDKEDAAARDPDHADVGVGGSSSGGAWGGGVGSGGGGSGGSGGGGSSVVVRKRGSMSDLSGGGGLVYSEISRGGGDAPKHKLFAQREREKKKAKAAKAQQGFSGGS